MSIWVDGDACPKVIKQIIFRAAIKRSVLVTIVANHYAVIPPSPFIKRVIVSAGFDKADNYIITHLQSKELVITADIILADHVIAKQAYALNPRGTLYSANNIKQILSMRNLNESLRDNGLISGGADKLSSKEIQNFSNHLDRFISSLSKNL
ncbi:YaiI/YqxD family protein [Legionella gresilensis]|uniref:YaiI/YqxD family protein n=1 Tax=Legionella gresilensis TaxID=91823 RepID=UPI001040F2A3|nr:YaiI/YqxD family protein [Legionella gresilensis]